MLRIALITVLVLHGLIHFMGVGKAYRPDALKALRETVSPGGALAWGAAALLLLAAASMLGMHSDHWWMPALAGVVLSQVLIIAHWQDARFGTVANVLLAIAVVLGACTSSFRREYRGATAGSLQAVVNVPEYRITAADLAPLPDPVQRFLHASGVIGTIRPRSMRITFNGELRAIDGPWMPFTSTQVNTFDPPTRSFWLDAVMKGLPTKGWHHYDDGRATMLIKLLGAIPVQDLQGAALDTTETVTWFNDLCLFAPGALIDPRISWRVIDDHRAEATFTHKGIRISATLVFDEQDRLVDFISDDRSYLAPNGALQRERFSTPASDHRIVNGVRVPGFGEAVWQLEEGAFTYGRFRVTDLEYDPPIDP